MVSDQPGIHKQIPHPGRKVDMMSRPVAQIANIAVNNSKVASDVVAPIAPNRVIKDVASEKTAEVIRNNPVTTADSFHARLKPARGGVLDLRTLSPKPVSPAKEAQPVIVPEKKHVSVEAKKMHSPAEHQAKMPHTSTATIRKNKNEDRLKKAIGIEKNPKISRFAPPKRIEGKPSIIEQPVSKMPETIMTNHVAAQHEHLSRLLEISVDKSSKYTKIKERPTRASFAAAAIAIVIIGGYIYLHNYQNLVITSASSKAGFAATLPTFVPSSYSLKGPVDYSPGLVTIEFNSPSFSSKIHVTQQQTNWDSASLLVNYVEPKTNSFTTINSQGLTIYLLNKTQEATWINHGVWFTIEGGTNIGRDQLLKMAYSF